MVNQPRLPTNIEDNSKNTSPVDKVFVRKDFRETPKRHHVIMATEKPAPHLYTPTQKRHGTGKFNFGKDGDEISEYIADDGNLRKDLIDKDANILLEANTVNKIEVVPEEEFYEDEEEEEEM
ncbi:hypothetical protein ABK040_000249 [Willaertia magna]